jgi:DNA-binding IclR family transcriptional regulator
METSEKNIPPGETSVPVMFNPKKKEPGSNKDRYLVTSAARGLDVLEIMARNGKPMTAVEVASALDLPRTTAFRLLSTLQEKNWVYKERFTYSLGFKCFQLGATTGVGLEIRTHALPFLVSLRDRSNLNTQIAKLEDWNVVYLERVLGNKLRVSTPSRAGAILPAHCTALGKVLLAYKDLEQVTKWAQENPPEQLTEKTITAVPLLIAEILETRERGYAVEYGEREDHIHCIGAPVTDFSGSVVAAVSVSGTPDRLPEKLVGSDLAKDVCATAEQISLALGSPNHRKSIGIQNRR